MYVFTKKGLGYFLLIASLSLNAADQKKILKIHVPEKQIRPIVPPGGPAFDSDDSDDEEIDDKKGPKLHIIIQQDPLNAIKLLEGTARELLNAYVYASKDDVQAYESKCNAIFTQLRGNDQLSALFRKEFEKMQLRRAQRLIQERMKNPRELLKLLQSKNIPKDEDSSALHQAQQQERVKACRGCCWCNHR